MDKINNAPQPVTQVKPINPVNEQGSPNTNNEHFNQQHVISDDQLNKAIDRVNFTLHMDNTSLQIEFDKESNRSVAQIIDKSSGEIVRQIPSKQFLEWEKEFTRITGLLFDKKA